MSMLENSTMREEKIKQFKKGGNDSLRAILEFEYQAIAYLQTLDIPDHYKLDQNGPYKHWLDTEPTMTSESHRQALLMEVNWESLQALLDPIDAGEMLNDEELQEVRGWRWRDNIWEFEEDIIDSVEGVFRQRRCEDTGIPHLDR